MKTVKTYLLTVTEEELEQLVQALAEVLLITDDQKDLDLLVKLQCKFDR